MLYGQVELPLRFCGLARASLFKSGSRLKRKSLTKMMFCQLNAQSSMFHGIAFLEIHRAVAPAVPACQSTEFTSAPNFD